MPFSREGVELVAIIGGQESVAFKVLRVDKSVGSNQLDHALVRIDFGAPGVERFVEDIDLTTLSVDLPEVLFDLQGKEVRIVARTESEDIEIHWGKATVQEIDCGDQESITLVSRIEDFHFGTPTNFQTTWDPATELPVIVDHYIVFNPEVNGGIVGNRNTNEDSAAEYYDVFVDPRSIETEDGALVHGVEDWHDPDNPDEINELSERNWNLSEAVLYLCYTCNPDEEYITNPSEGDLPNILPDDRGLLKNLVIPPGMYLPEALDRLLNPFGYYWYIEYQSETIRKIRIFQSGNGIQRELLWQEPGSVFDPTQTNTSQVRLTYDASMAVNQVRAYGDFMQLEATWELKPAWLEEHDSVELSELSKGMPEWNEPDYEYHRVWRDWVLNEGGDYPRTWNVMDESSWATVDVYFRAAFEDKMEDWAIVPKRRKFLPMLTRGPDGKPLGPVGGCVVEWFNPELPDADGGTGGNWEIINPDDESFSCQLLPGECGIRFTGTYPPMAIMDLGADAQVRITATIQSDVRMVALSEREDTSVNSDVNEVILDVGQHFHARLIDEDSKYYETVLSADTSDGWDSLQDFADAARKAFDQAQCSGNAVLEGIDHYEYTISDLITKVKGREISLALNTNPADAGLAYPQIVGISLDAQSQKTVLTLNEFKDTTAWIASYLRKTKRLK